MASSVCANGRLLSYLLFPENIFILLCLDNSFFKDKPIGVTHNKLVSLYLRHFLGIRLSLVSIFPLVSSHILNINLV